MNNVILTGRITNDLELKTSSSGFAYVRFGLAVGRGKRNGKDLGADFINCTAYRNSAVNLVKYQAKGDLILVRGKWTRSSYDKDGEKKYSDRCDVFDIEYLRKKNDSEQFQEQDYPFEEIYAEPFQVGFEEVEEIPE